MNRLMKWETVIGLEIHAQLSTKSKIFSGASTNYGANPNTQACAVDLGLPGVLPVINEQAILMAIKFGLAINAEIPERSVFARKNYFYPDLPKGYQISQFELPIVSNGYIEIKGDEKEKSEELQAKDDDLDGGADNDDRQEENLGQFQLLLPYGLLLKLRYLNHLLLDINLWQEFYQLLIKLLKLFQISLVRYLVL